MALFPSKQGNPAEVTGFELLQQKFLRVNPLSTAYNLQLCDCVTQLCVGVECRNRNGIVHAVMASSVILLSVIVIEYCN